MRSYEGVTKEVGTEGVQMCVYVFPSVYFRQSTVPLFCCERFRVTNEDLPSVLFFNLCLGAS